MAITRDQRFRYKPNERNTVIRHRVGLLVLIGTATHPELANSFVATLPKIERFLREQSLPFIAKVYRALRTERAKRPNVPGRIYLWYA